MRPFTKILLLSFSLMVSNGANGQNADFIAACEDAGGERQVANNITFCKSGQVMNWVSAYTWCEAIGGKLAEQSSVCPNGTCSALVGTFYQSGDEHYGYINTLSNGKGGRVRLDKTASITSVAANRPVGYDLPNAGSNYDKKAITNIFALCESK